MDCVQNAECEGLYAVDEKKKKECATHIKVMNNALQAISDGDNCKYRSYELLVPILNMYYYTYSSKAVIHVGLLACLVLVLFFIFRGYSSYGALTRDVVRTEAKVDTIIDKDHVVLDIVLPDYDGLEVSKKSKLIELSNPTENDFYLQYSISLGENVICNSIFIKPGDIAYWDAHTSLEEGENAVTLTITAYDLDSQEALGSADETVTIVKTD